VGSERLRNAIAAAAIAGSWPAVVALWLSRVFLLGERLCWPAVVAGYLLSIAISAGVAWRVWPSARASYGSWGFRGIVSVVPIAGGWIMVSEAAKPATSLVAIFLSPLGGLLLGGPMILFLGFVVGLDVAFVLRSFRNPRDAWVRFFAAVGLNYGAAIALAIAGRR
jgi:drug/metabolite transporter (DMT)-like permease